MHLFPSITLVVSFLMLAATEDTELAPEKRSFTELGCMGVFDRSKFARLERLCEECYQMFRESDVHSQCRSNCFKNTIFTLCVDALLLQKDQQKLGSMVQQLYG